MKWFNKFLERLGIEKGLVGVAGGNTIASLIGAAFWLLIAALSTTEEYGEVNYYFSIAMIASSLSLMGLNITVMTYLAKGEERVKNQANLVVLVSSCGATVVTFVLIGNIAAAILVFGISFFTMAQAEWLGRKDYKKYSYAVIAQRALLVPLSILLYFLIGIEGILFGYAISTLVFSYPFFGSLKISEIRLRELRPKSKFSLHSFSIVLTDRVGIYIDKLLIASLFGFPMLGLYQFGFQFLLFLTIIPISISQFLLPKEASGYEDKKILKISTFIAIFLSILFFITIPIIVKSFFPHFEQSILAAQIMVFSIIPLSITNVLTAKMFARGFSKPPFLVAIIRIILLIILIIFLGSNFGLIGMALAVVISSTIQTVVLSIKYKVYIKSNER